LKVALEFVEADAERTRLGLDPNEFAVYTMLKEYVPEGLAAEHAKGVSAVFTRFPDYQWDAHQLQQLRTALYQAMRPLVGGDIKRAIAAGNDLLKLRRV